MMLIALAFDPTRDAIVRVQHHQQPRDDAQHNDVLGIGKRGLHRLHNITPPHPSEGGNMQEGLEDLPEHHPELSVRSTPNSTRVPKHRRIWPR